MLLRMMMLMLLLLRMIMMIHNDDDDARSVPVTAVLMELVTVPTLVVMVGCLRVLFRLPPQEGRGQLGDQTPAW